MEKEVGFEHIHKHTDWSLLDGYAQVEEYAEYSASVNQKYLCITDHGMLGAVPRQVRACDIAGLKPVFGIEAYLNDKHIPKSEMAKLSLSDEEKAEIGKNYHLLMLAYSNKGYSNLVQLSSKSWLQFYKKPRVTYAQIDEHKEGVIFTSSCYIGEIGQAFDKYGSDKAEEVLKRYIDWFKPNFYLEIMLLDFKKQRPYNAWLVKMHDKYHVPITLSQDCHYCRKEDSQQQRRMLMIRGKKTEKDFENIEDSQDHFELQDTNLWMKSEEELDEKYWKRELDGFSYSDIIPDVIYTQAKKNSVEICRKCEGVEIDRSLKLPQIPDADEKLKAAVISGYARRGLTMKSKYLNRLSEELSLICRKGFSSYFLIQQEIIQEARRVCPQILGWGNGDEAIGPGRGCLSPDVRIVVSDGTFKPISEMKAGDRVVTQDGSIQLVEKVLEYDCNETLLNIKTYYGDNSGVTLTEDHKVLVEKLVRPDGYDQWSESTKKARKSCLEPIGNLEWKPASDVEVGDWLFIPKPHTNYSDIAVIDLSNSIIDDRDIVVDSNLLHQDWFNPLTGSLRKRKTCSRFVEFDNDWAKFLGLFTGDGWLIQGRNTCVGIAFNSEDSEGIDFVIKLCNKYGWEYYEDCHSSKKLVQFMINSRILHDYFKAVFDKYDYSSQTKYVPDVIFTLNPDKKVSFLHGYMMSDGHHGEYKKTYTTSSSRLASQVRYLSWQCNMPASLNAYSRIDPRSGVESNGFTINFSEEGMVQYNFRVVKQGLLVKIREINKVPSCGKVYDLTVANNHNYLTTSFLVHNSCVGSLICYCLNITDVDPLKHDLLFSRFLPESRGGREMKTMFTGIPIPEPFEYEEAA